MSEQDSPFEAMLSMSRDWAKSLNPALESFSPTAFESLWPTMPREVMEAVMGKTFNPGGLDAKTKLLLTLGALTMLGAQADAQIRLTVRHAIEAGATKQEVAETIAVMGVFCGVPAMTRAMELANSAMKPDDGEAT